MGFILFSPSGLVGVGERLLAPLLRRKTVSGAMAQRVMPTPGQAIPEFLRVHSPVDGAVLVCKQVTKRFGGFTAVDGVDFRLVDRKLHALIGPNGAGKTTLFNAAIEGESAERVVALGLARSFQITSLFQQLTVWENLRLACQARDAQRLNPWKPAHRLTVVNEETRALVKFLGLEGVEQANVSDLS